MITEEYNKGFSFRVPTLSYGNLCDCISKVPGVIFTERRTFFWWGSNVGAKFTLRGHKFIVETDSWDGALWIMTEDATPHPNEMQELRENVEKHGKTRGIIRQLFRQIINQTFT